MEEVNRVAGRFKISLTDSTMMWIVYRAMDKAYERAQSKEGVIERLTEISKFYELAVMQLEGCLRFVQEETDSSFESSDEDVLGDLTEIRDRLIGRLKELDLAIAEKDRELTERSENELKLGQALEIKKRQMDSIRAKLKLEPTKVEGVEDSIPSNRVGVDELTLGNRANADEEFSGLKHSVDRQVWNIKHKLEPEDRRRNRSCDSLKIEQMGSDIDVLKETMDVAFGKMQSAIFLSEMGPVEQQWRLTIEKDALGILIKGFVRDIQESFKAQVRGREKQVSLGLSKHLSDLMKDINCLNDELEALCLSQSNQDRKISLKPKEKSLSEEDDHGNPGNSTLSVEKVDQQKQLGEGDPEDDGGNYVAKLIKNHESIIKRKNKELNLMKRENLGEKDSSYPRREEDLVSPRRRIQDVIVRMENLITWNAKLGENFGNYESDDDVESSSTKRLCNFSMTKQKKSHIDNLEVGQGKVNEVSISGAVNEELHNEIRVLKEEKEDVSFQAMIMEKTCASVLEGFIYEFRTDLYRYDLEILSREGIHEDSLKKIVLEWNEQMESHQLEIQFREEIHYIVFGEAVKNFVSTLDSTLIECQDARAECSCLEDYNLEGKLREEISRVLFREVYKEWNELVKISDTGNLVREEIHQIAIEETLRDIANTTDYIISVLKEENLEGELREDIWRLLFGELCKEWNEVMKRLDDENLVREEIYQVAFDETLRDVANTGNHLVSKCNDGKNSENCIHGFHCNKSFQCAEHSVKEDVYMVFLREMFKEWKGIDAQNFESLIREEVFLLAFFEAVKEASAAYREGAAYDHFKISEDFICPDKLHRSKEVSEEEILVQNQESLLNCIRVEEDLIRSTSSEIKEHNAHCHPIQMKHEKLDKVKISQELFTEMGSAFNSVSSKVEIALEQLAVSKALLSELRSCLGVAVEDVERINDRTVSVASAHNLKPSWLQQKEIKEVKVTPSYCEFIPIKEFLQVFMDFKCRVEEKLELNILRLEEAMHHLNPVTELVARHRRKEWLYKKAFIRRCENLRKAETEVDLLGDQVEVLLGLLEKIYNVLHHYSPVLQQYFEVLDILNMIRKVLIGEVLASSDTDC
ncbi:hypothetical protein P3X46_014084 [Hevea brasiliensis]|uniref:WPP domain-associated protein n=1 Tax=Hevea brasiliensis TaxID=3981 RepID=A0ABQ9M9E2_HEVBR|nr:uncharacterized protein LOC131182538 [Hevea brasiliensis]KAJ9175538.1 hypothetical protein P3X46_014084 [Hevea brasiliensis]